MSPSQALKLVVLSLCLGRGSSQNDETMRPGATGAGVVEAVCSRIEASCVFNDDKLFSRRLAYVESNDGLSSGAFREGYHGGIWQVDEKMFKVTQNSSLNSYFLNISKEFNIDWNRVKWTDLIKPLYSGLASRLFLQYHLGVQEIPRSIKDQADFWKRYYRPFASATTFTRTAKNFEKRCSNNNGADIMFMLDESGSIGAQNFEKMRSFMKDVVRLFDVGPESHQYRIGVSTFSYGVTREFDLDDYKTTDAVLGAVDKIVYIGGSTATHKALNDLVDVSFTAARGARPTNTGHPKVAIVVTDGVSNSRSTTAAAAQRLHAANIITFAVGVGTTLDFDELRGIASDPDCIHFILLKEFNEFGSLKDTIEKRTCEAPIAIIPGEITTLTLPAAGEQNCKIKIFQNGTTIQLNVDSGEIYLYLSYSTNDPSEEFFDHKITAKSGRLGVIALSNTKQKTRTIRSIEQYATYNSEQTIFGKLKASQSTKTKVTIEALPGDHDKCKTRSCLNGGGCYQDMNGRALCDCPPFYTGDDCQTINLALTLKPKWMVLTLALAVRMFGFGYGFE